MNNVTYRFAKKNVLSSSYNEMKENLANKKNILEYDGNRKSLNEYIRLFVPLVILSVTLLSFYNVFTSSSNDRTFLIYQSAIIGIFFLQAIYLIYDKKIVLLSKYKDFSGKDIVAISILSLLPTTVISALLILEGRFLTALEFDLVGQVKSASYLITVLIMVIALYGFLKNHYAYFIPLSLNLLALVFMSQYSAAEGTFGYADFLYNLQHALILLTICVGVAIYDFMSMHKQYKRNNL